MNPQQARSDARDDRRVFVWGVIAVIVLILIGLLGLYALDKRGEGPPNPTSAGQQTRPGAGPPSAR